MEQMSLIAGTISGLIFISSHVPMLLKAFCTQDLHSYSRLNLLLVNVGNLIYWLYLVSLPLGPVWVLHTFYTISSGLLLILFEHPTLLATVQKRKGGLLCYGSNHKL
ncbi:MAG TPA: hypothetical protein VEC96_01640 [Anaerolineae bacterium]|nr:hypothetical protein [Anaerolineae bacterium]